VWTVSHTPKKNYGFGVKAHTYIYTIIISLINLLIFIVVNLSFILIVLHILYSIKYLPTFSSLFRIAAHFYLEETSAHVSSAQMLHRNSVEISLLLYIFSEIQFSRIISLLRIMFERCWKNDNLLLNTNQLEESNCHLSKYAGYHHLKKKTGQFLRKIVVKFCVSGS